MAQINPNDPTFPTLSYQTSSGISIRTQLAAMAMTGLLSNQTVIESIANNEKGDPTRTAQNVAKSSVRFADALIEELNKEK